MKECPSCNNDGSIVYEDDDGEERDDLCIDCHGFDGIPETDAEKLAFVIKVLRVMEMRLEMYDRRLQKLEEGAHKK